MDMKVYLHVKTEMAMVDNNEQNIDTQL